MIEEQAGPGVAPPMNAERHLPPVTQVAMLSLALIVAGGIDLSSHIPSHVSLAPPAILLGLSALLMAGNLVSLARVNGFRWDRFFSVARWALLAYLTISGLIEYAFVRNHVRGGTLVVLTLSLVVFAIHVPTLIGFTVARYADDGADAGRSDGAASEASRPGAGAVLLPSGHPAAGGSAG
jgi:hypothetical protein